MAVERDSGGVAIPARSSDGGRGSAYPRRCAHGDARDGRLPSSVRLVTYARTHVRTHAGTPETARATHRWELAASKRRTSGCLGPWAAARSAWSEPEIHPGRERDLTRAVPSGCAPCRPAGLPRSAASRPSGGEGSSSAAGRAEHAADAPGCWVGRATPPIRPETIRLSRIERGDGRRLSQGQDDMTGVDSLDDETIELITERVVAALRDELRGARLTLTPTRPQGRLRSAKSRIGWAWRDRRFTHTGDSGADISSGLARRPQSASTNHGCCAHHEWNKAMPRLRAPRDGAVESCSRTTRGPSGFVVAIPELSVVEAHAPPNGDWSTRPPGVRFVDGCFRSLAYESFANQSLTSGHRGPMILTYYLSSLERAPSSGLIFRRYRGVLT